MPGPALYVRRRPGVYHLPRVVLNGGNPALVEIIKGKRDPDTQAILPMTLQDLQELDVLLTRLHPALMAFDPIQAFSAQTSI